eukprot:112518_1
MPSKLIKLAASIAAISTLMVTSSAIAKTSTAMVDSADLFKVQKTEAAPATLMGTWLDASSSKKLDVYDLLCHAVEASDLLRKGLTEEDAQSAMELINKWNSNIQQLRSVAQQQEAEKLEQDLLAQIESISNNLEKELGRMITNVVENKYPQADYRLKRIQQEKETNGADNVDLDQSKSESSVVSIKKYLKLEDQFE